MVIRLIKAANDGCNSELVSATTTLTTSENLHLEIAKGD
jgi:hypothetical protein